MSCFKEWLNNAREKYLSIKNSLQDCNKTSPNNTQASLKALELFIEMEKELNDFQGKDEIVNCIKMISALLNYEMGLISFMLEKIPETEIFFLKSMDNIEERATTSECISLYIDIFSQVSIMSTKYNEYDLSEKACMKALDAFDKYKFSKNPPPVLMFEDLFLPVEQRQSESDAGSANLYLLQNSLLKKVVSLFNPTSVSNRLTKLKQLLKENVSEEERLLFAAQCHSLFLYFMKKENFTAARYLLSCANKVADDFEKMLKLRNEDKNSVLAESLLNAKTLIHHSWGLYAGSLLFISLMDKKKLKANLEAYLTARVPRDNTESTVIKMPELFKKDEIKEYEEKIICNLASSYTEALKIFQFGQNNMSLYENSDAKCCISKTNIYFQLDRNILYFSLAGFVEDPDIKCKLYKREVDLLHTALEKIDKQRNPKVYHDIACDLCSAYSSMLHIKYDICTSCSEKATLHNIAKVNLLAGKLIKLIESHLDLYRDENTQFPKSLQEDIVEQVMMMLHQQSGAYQMLISDNKKRTLQNITKAKELCKCIIDYIAGNPSHQRFIEDNLPLAVVNAHFFELVEKEVTLLSEIS